MFAPVLCQCILEVSRGSFETCVTSCTPPAPSLRVFDCSVFGTKSTFPMKERKTDFGQRKTDIFGARVARFDVVLM